MTDPKTTPAARPEPSTPQERALDAEAAFLSTRIPEAADLSRLAAGVLLGQGYPALAAAVAVCANKAEAASTTYHFTGMHSGGSAAAALAAVGEHLSPRRPPADSARRAGPGTVRQGYGRGWSADKIVAEFDAGLLVPAGPATRKLADLTQAAVDKVQAAIESELERVRLTLMGQDITGMVLGLKVGYPVVAALGPGGTWLSTISVQVRLFGRDEPMPLGWTIYALDGGAHALSDADRRVTGYQAGPRP